MDYSVGGGEIGLIQATLHPCNVSRIYPLVSRTQQSIPLRLDQPHRCSNTCGVFTSCPFKEPTFRRYLGARSYATGNVSRNNFINQRVRLAKFIMSRG
jgi:hypothetical protein